MQCSFITYRTSSKSSWPPKPWLDVRLNHGSEQKAEYRSLSPTEDRQGMADPATHLMETEMEWFGNNEENLENKETQTLQWSISAWMILSIRIQQKILLWKRNLKRKISIQKIITNRNQILDRVCKYGCALTFDQHDWKNLSLQVISSLMRFRLHFPLMNCQTFFFFVSLVARQFYTALDF